MDKTPEKRVKAAIDLLKLRADKEMAERVLSAVRQGGPVDAIQVAYKDASGALSRIEDYFFGTA